MTDPYDRPAGTASKALFGAGVAAVAIGRAVAVARERRQQRKNRKPHPLAEGAEASPEDA